MHSSSAMSPNQSFLFLHTTITFTFFLLSNNFFLSSSSSSSPSNNYQYQNCSSTFNCGSFKGLSYPFWSNNRPQYCGHPGFKLTCPESINKNLVAIEFSSQTFNLLNINMNAQYMTLLLPAFSNNPCPNNSLPNTTLDPTTLNYTSNTKNVTFFYYCPSSNTLVPSNYNNSFTCPEGSYFNNKAYYFENPVPHSFSIGSFCGYGVVVPMLRNALEAIGNGSLTVWGGLKEGFEVEWIGLESRGKCNSCVSSGGVCGYDWNLNEATCLCREGVNYNSSGCGGLISSTSSDSSSTNGSTGYGSTPDIASPGKSDKTKIRIGVGIGIFGIVIIINALYFLYIHRYNKHRPPTNTIDQQSRIIPSNSYTLSNLENGDNYLGVNLFSYDELEEATKHFNPSNELGDGGFGTVYHAKLGDGREVAIKRLYENNSKRVQQFMNEIEILARLRHKNLVTLYGYSSQQSKELLLVYEYIPNGTVADHLHGTKRSLTKTDYEFSPLPWHTRLSIATETASALVYLHASDIIHRDVKTNNILLDNNFSVKVADFGLSRLFPLDVTHVSTSPQGTPGYVDPEYHQCYHLTDKSDVYSFGVVLVELVSSKLAVDMTRHRHEINLSNMAIHKIQNDLLHELVDASLGFDSDFKVKKEVTRVAELAFQCLQQEREMRPTMEEVLEILTSIHQEIKIKRIDDENYVGVVQGDVVDIPVDDAFRLKSELSPVSSPEGKGKSDSSSARTSQFSC